VGLSLAVVLLAQSAGAVAVLKPLPSDVILFSSSRDGTTGLYLVNADGSGLRKLTLSQPPADIGASCVALSPDGSRLAYQSRDESLVVIGGGHSKLFRGISCGAWSPDGRKIAYTTWRSGGSELDLVDVVSGRRVVLTRPPPGDDDGSAQWSPDGRRIMFLRHERNSNYGSSIYVVGRNGTGLRLLSGGVGGSVVYPPSWSPDGQRIAFDAWHGLFVIRATGTGRRRISSDQFVPVWSPRGDEIALTGYTGGVPGVFVVHPDGSGLRHLLSVGSGLSTVRWSADGRQLAVQADFSLFDYADIYVVDVATGSSQRITQSWRYGYVLYLGQWAPRSTAALASSPVSWAIPSDSVAEGNVLRTRAPVEQLAADGGEVAALSTSPGRCALELWNPGAPDGVVRFPSVPCQALPGFNDLALGAGQVAFPVSTHQAGTNWRGILIGTRDQPAFEHLTGLCTTVPSGSPFFCVRPPIGDLKAQGSLFVFDSWEGPDFYCDQPCPPPKRNGGLWRVDGSSAVEIASSGGALTPLAVDAGRILVDHEDGTLELMSSGGSSLQTFHVDTGDFLGAKVQGRDVVVLKRDTIADYDADSGALLHEWPLPPGDRQFEGLRDGVAVLVSGREIHLFRLADGHDAVIEIPGTGRVLAQLDESGLFYSYSVDDPTYPGRVAFLPFNQLPID
jgi:WD40 repeat protein